MPLTRREFVSSLAAVAAPQAPRWNLLMLTNDQHRADCLGAMGNPVIRTPNLDRLAAQGALFAQHYVQCPQCVPSRAALHTGRYPHVNRTPTNLYQLPQTEQTLASVLNRAGYLTATCGELPFAPTNHLGGFRKVVASHLEHEASLLAGGWAAPGIAHAMAIKKDFQAVPVPWPEEFDETAFFARKAIGFLKENAGQPFFLQVNFRRPHHPFDPPAPFDKMYSGAAFPPSHRREGEMKNKPPGQQKAIESTAGFDLRNLTPRDLERVKSYYYGMISLNDKYIGQILDALQSLGLADRTVVVFNADHGEMLGDHGLLFKGGYMYDEVVRAPLILRAPGKLPPGQRFAHIVEEVDVLPTVLQLLGVEAPPGVQGRCLLDRTARVAHAEFPNMKMLRTRDGKLVHYPRARYGELYNLREDPHELHNLYDEPAYAGRRHELEAALLDWLIDSQDPLRPPIKA